MHKGFKCLDVNTGRIYISRDVTFDENVFPFTKLHPNAGAKLRDQILLLSPSLIPSNILPNGVDKLDNSVPNPGDQTPGAICGVQVPIPDGSSPEDDLPQQLIAAPAAPNFQEGFSPVAARTPAREFAPSELRLQSSDIDPGVASPVQQQCAEISASADSSTPRRGSSLSPQASAEGGHVESTAADVESTAVVSSSATSSTLLQPAPVQRPSTRLSKGIR
jgi:hypothetical protein